MLFQVPPTPQNLPASLFLLVVLLPLPARGTRRLNPSSPCCRILSAHYPCCLLITQIRMTACSGVDLAAPACLQICCPRLTFFSFQSPPPLLPDYSARELLLMDNYTFAGTGPRTCSPCLWIKLTLRSGRGTVNLRPGTAHGTEGDGMRMVGEDGK